jgi:hypothetical protein
MNKTKIKEHFIKYWWTYLLGIIILYAGYKFAEKKGLFPKKKGPSKPDIDNSIALGLAQGLWPELDFQQPICVGESGEYVTALHTIMRTGHTLARPAGMPDVNIWNGATTFDNALNNYIDYYVNISPRLQGQNNLTYSGCINISNALKLGSAIIN